MPRKLHMFTCSSKKRQWYQIATENQTMLGFEQPLTRCCTVTMEPIRTLSSGTPLPQIGIPIGFPNPARQVPSSWHTQDGFFLHKRKGKVTSCFPHCNSNEFLSKHTWLRYNLPRQSDSASTWSQSLDKCKEWIKIVLDFRTKNNIKIMLWSI